MVAGLKILLALFLLKAGIAHAASKTHVHLFPEPLHVLDQKKFWIDVFHKYQSYTTIIHDATYPSVIIDVINFKAFSRQYKNGSPYSQSERRELANRYKKRYQKAIKRIRRYGKKALRFGPMEERVIKVYGNHLKAKKNMMKGKARIRSQNGLKDEFQVAAKRAQNLLPYMEHIFRQNGLPINLTRICFVESMFNTKARSLRGASGVWQFIPSTAKDFMTVNNWIDERNSPIKASVAAARLLKRNYKILKSWPLAITAYNHGAYGMQRAKRQQQSDDMEKIILNYKSDTFGFASKNFYAEFLAARYIYNTYYRHKTRFDSNPQNIAKIKVPKGSSLFDLLRYTPLTEKILKKHNLDLGKKAFSRHLQTPLPRGFEIFVPQHLAARTQNSFLKLSARSVKKWRRRI